MSRTARSLSASLAIAAALAAVAPAFAANETFTIDGGHSDVKFKIRHLVARVSGGFNTFTGEIMLDEKDLAKGSVKFEIDAASIDTNSPDRDGHLKSPDFFDVEKFPKITFESTKVAVKKPSEELLVTGNLSMHGVTKPVDLTVMIGGFGADPWGNYKAGFEVMGKINRKDFGIVWNKNLDQGGTVLGDDVEIMINIEANKKKAEEKK